MQQQHVHCSVSNCHYWSQGNKCSANEILVTTDRLGDSLPERFDATQAKNVTPTPVNSCMETCCKSFVEKGSKNINVDGITRI
ncbi:MAG TPA: DUF1540 domain-containing protein [Clostridia bacterium]|nr:DUF1540 domain-containing protein [Clostridia bacterium]